ncbi:MAG: NTP transferase domain-containing protein [Eubacteriaceae bacterium]|nr:NTP transferase domain-containing protein [Eubacteriaceae bacterium]
MIAALIIASGKTSTRDGFVPHREVGTIPAIQRIIILFQRAGIERIVVVCEEDGAKTEKLASHMNVVFLHSQSDAEMLDNVKAGLAYLQDKCTAALVTHSDVPLYTVETVRTLIASEGPICIPAINGATGHPLLLRSDQFQPVLTYKGEGGLAGAVRATGIQPNLVEVQDEGILTNVYYDSNYTHLVNNHSLKESYPDIRVRIAKEQPFYDAGAHLLLQLTEETNSLRQACRRMGISYGKGRAIISLIEQQLGYPILHTQQGGKTGGHSVVTGDGKKLMSNYTCFMAEAKQSILELFEKHFSG